MTQKRQKLKEKGLGRKSLKGRLRTGKRRTRKKSENKKRLFFFGLAMHNREAARKYSRAIARGIEYELKKRSFVTGEALPGVVFELVIPEFLVDNTMPFEKEQF